LLSQSTSELINDRIPLRPVDRVRVKGKNVPVNIFTPSKNDALVTLTKRAWDDYLRRDWISAHESWNEIRKIIPDDSLIDIFKERITAHESSPPPPDWDGSVALEKL
jgi:adenylate cyclase